VRIGSTERHRLSGRGYLCRFGGAARQGAASRALMPMEPSEVQCLTARAAPEVVVL